MESFFEKRRMARHYVRQLEANLNGQTRHQIFETLKQFRRRNISPSTAVATVQNLLRDRPDLLPAFDPFMPRNNSNSAAKEDSILQASLNFLNRIRTRFAGIGVYKEFLDCLHSHSRGEGRFSEIYDNVLKLFGNNPDLVADFQSFLLISNDQKRCKKRKAADHGKGNCKKRMKADDDKVWKKTKADDDSMEDSLFEVDVKLSNVRAARTNAAQLMNRLCHGGFSPMDVCYQAHFTPLNMACIRSTYSSKVADEDEISVFAVSELIDTLTTKEKELEKCRVGVWKKWNKIRHSRNPH